MVVMSASNIGKSYGTDVILENISFHIDKGDRVGIVGVNGAGKTTLLNIMTGELTESSGGLFIAKDQKLGYLKQSDNFNEKSTIIEAAEEVFQYLKDMEKEILNLNEKISVLAGQLDNDTENLSVERELEDLYRRVSYLQDIFHRENGFGHQSKLRGILNAMNFPEEVYSKEVGTLSGGERTRLALACLLMQKPDILILDEPTNHLDMGTLGWLEQYVSSYKGTVIMTSHDRFFLDETVNKIFDVENHHLKVYKGNYTQFVEQKKAQREADLKAYKKEAEEIKRQEELIRKYKERGTEKLAKRAASREKRLEKIDRKAAPVSEQGSMALRFKENYQSGKDVFFGENIVKYLGTGEDRRKVLGNLNFDIKRGEKICIIGENGTGKTTFLKILTEELLPNEGYFKIGHNVDIGYYDQNQDTLNPNNTLMNELHDEFTKYTDGEIRGFLGRFLFTQEQVFLNVSDLSGGEKGRLTLIKLMLGGHNVLIMDEPTNHLDIQSKEVIEEALTAFDGTVIVVSHDRYFLNRIPGRILEMTSNGFKEYLGNYKYYLEKTKQEKLMEESNGKTEVTNSLGICKNSQKKDSESSKLDAASERKLQKQKDAEKRRLVREKEKIETEMIELEAELDSLHKEMSEKALEVSHQELANMGLKQEERQIKLEQLEERWLEIEEELLEF